MTHAVDASILVQTVSAFLYVALGVWVLTLKPRRLQTKLLGAFAILFGMIYLPYDLGQIFDLIQGPGPLQNAIQQLFNVLAYPVALGLAWAVPEPLEDRRLLGTAVALGVAFRLVSVGIRWVAVPGPDLSPFAAWVDASLGVVILGTFFAALFLLALRAHPSRNPSRGEVTQLALLCVALAMFFAFISGANILDLAENLVQNEPLFALLGVLALLPWFVVAGLWGWNMLQADDETVRIHRAAMLGILGLVTAGAVYFGAFPAVDPGSNVMRGVMRTLGVGLLAYGILRHDLAGLDAKVEYGLSKTTVAGVFVAVFFIVSEGAQALFADFAGNEFLGVIAAGALVFAISPLQRLADRFAAKAVPGDGAADASEAEATYRRMVAKHLADGGLTAEEERDLGRLARQLGIDAERAVELRLQVEDEVLGGVAG